jgi:hypothetical protein
MAIGHPTDRKQLDPESPAAEDRVVESAILGFVLSEHPAYLTRSELALAMNRDRNDFAADDELERAMGELVGAGLLHLVSDVVLPTRAALYRDGLEID